VVLEFAALPEWWLFVQPLGCVEKGNAAFTGGILKGVIQSGDGETGSLGQLQIRCIIGAQLVFAGQKSNSAQVLKATLIRLNG